MPQETILAEYTDLLTALRAIDAALNQHATYPADVELARKVARAAIEQAQLAQGFAAAPLLPKAK